MVWFFLLMWCTIPEMHNGPAKPSRSARKRKVMLRIKGFPKASRSALHIHWGPCGWRPSGLCCREWPGKEDKENETGNVQSQKTFTQNCTETQSQLELWQVQKASTVWRLFMSKALESNFLVMQYYSAVNAIKFLKYTTDKPIIYMDKRWGFSVFEGCSFQRKVLLCINNKLYNITLTSLLSHTNITVHHCNSE